MMNDIAPARATSRRPRHHDRIPRARAAAPAVATPEVQSAIGVAASSLDLHSTRLPSGRDTTRR